MKTFIILCLSASVLSCIHSFGQNATQKRHHIQPNPFGYENEINAFLRSDSVKFPPVGAYLFTGSSTIAKWKNLREDFKEIRVIPRGFGGSNIRALNYYANDIVLPYKPKAIVVYEGDNDLAAGESVDSVMARFARFERMVHHSLPRCKLYILSIKPSPVRRQYLSVQTQANQRLKALAKHHAKTQYVDITHLMYDKQGHLRSDCFLGDSLHITDECYKVWAAYMKKAMGIKK